MFNKDEIKANLSMDQIESLLEYLGGEPRVNNEIIISKTICHCGQSHKLYYYNSSHLFHCYTECGDSFDVFGLIQKINDDCSLPKAVSYITSFFGISSVLEDFSDSQKSIQDWDKLKEYDKLQSITEQKKIELKEYDKTILRRLPHPEIKIWEKEGISQEVMNKRGICYNPVNESIVIPHYDMNNKLIGIRERTLIKENEVYGKYKPAYINGKMYNHPLSFALYNLNNSKKNIALYKKAFIFESEKSTMQYASMFGEENDISVAVCGSNLLEYQVQLLLGLGVQEICIGFDKQFKEIGDEEFQKWTKKLMEIHKKYSPFVNISFLFDKQGDLLDYKDSPTDKGKETFLKLYERRIYL